MEGEEHRFQVRILFIYLLVHCTQLIFRLCTAKAHSPRVFPSSIEGYVFHHVP